MCRARGTMAAASPARRPAATDPAAVPVAAPPHRPGCLPMPLVAPAGLPIPVRGLDRPPAVLVVVDLDRNVLARCRPLSPAVARCGPLSPSATALRGSVNSAWRCARRAASVVPPGSGRFLLYTGLGTTAALGIPPDPARTPMSCTGRPRLVPSRTRRVPQACAQSLWTTRRGPGRSILVRPRSSLYRRAVATSPGFGSCPIERLERMFDSARRSSRTLVNGRSRA
jgi:hypothetical protein